MVVALSAHLTLTKDEIIENNLDQAIKIIVQTEATLKQSVEKLKHCACASATGFRYSGSLNSLEK
jgi:hypothetical protein